MNIRFAQNEIRFRVTHEEFEKLLEGEYVELETIPLNFVVQIAKKPLDQGMVIDLSCGAVHLVISPDEMTEFRSHLPNKKGIEKRLSMGTGRTLDVAFEVDVRS